MFFSGRPDSSGFPSSMSRAPAPRAPWPFARQSWPWHPVVTTWFWPSVRKKLYLNDTALSIKAMATNTDVEIMGGLGFQFTGGYAMSLKKYMRDYGWTRKQFAQVAAKNKYNGSLNPNAQYQKPLTVEEILNSRLVAWPLTLYMCSTMADGAAAALVCASDSAENLGDKPPLRISACCLQSGQVSPEDDGQKSVAKEAYEMAGLGPDEIELAEVHDAMAPGEMFRVANLGLGKPEEIGKMVETGHFSLKGRAASQYEWRSGRPGASHRRHGPGPNCGIGLADARRGRKQAG